VNSITSIFEAPQYSEIHAQILNIFDMRRLIFLLTGALFFILSACTKYQIPAPECPEDLPTNVSFSGDIQPIFNANCIACHSGGQSPNLSEGWAYDELSDGGYVDTDFPCESKIYEVLTGSHTGRATDDEVLTILGWIDEGAQDN
jgi:hypothetical protein